MNKTVEKSGFKFTPGLALIYIWIKNWTQRFKNFWLRQCLYLQTLTLLQSSALRTVPLKYDTWTKCFLSRDCISASGKKLNKKIKTTDQRVTSNMKIVLLIKCYISDTFGCALSANLLFFETFWCHLWFLEQTHSYI